MASAYPPTLERRHKSERAFANQLVALEAVRLSNPFTRTLAYWSVSLAVHVTGAMKIGRSTPIDSIARPPVHQAHPETSEAFAADAIQSAFSRSIARDAKQYEAYRKTIAVRSDTPDPAPVGDDTDLFPALTAYRDSMGV
jgi:hypothetical protein